jgi:DOPA 4,5-dioxygenase
MSAALRRIDEIASYHAHVYFDPASERERAMALREALGARFLVRLGKIWDHPVGPHPQAMYQVAFAPDLFARIVPWLMLNHAGLSILIHPSTTRPRQDHLGDALWIGARLTLSEEGLPEHDPVAEAPGEPNTEPTLAP